MKLFDVAKVGIFLDTIKHQNEARTSGEVKVITLSCRVEPFDSKLAVAIGDVVRATLFKLSSGDPQGHIRRCDFALGIERQKAEIFAAPDTGRASIAFDQVKISRLYARAQKDGNQYVLVFDMTFGPVGKTELAYVEAWRGTQRFVTFDAAEPNLEEFPDTADEEDDDEPADGAPRPTPMFDSEGDGRPLEAGPDQANDREPARHTPRRHPRQTH